jgi:hypothetical protein
MTLQETVMRSMEPEEETAYSQFTELHFPGERHDSNRNHRFRHFSVLRR